VPLPQIDPEAFPHASYSISFNLVVNAAASPEEKDAAWRFIAFLTNQPERWFRATQMLQPRVGWFETETARDIPGLETFVFDLENSRPLTRSPNYGVMESALASAIERVALNGADPAESLQQAADEFRRNAGL
jgi:sn-glycerol 3-phosphate transport system substrate-binding protein